jgi:hypothetical protein
MNLKSGKDAHKIGWANFQVAMSSAFFAAVSLAYMIGYFRKIGFNEIHIGIYGAIIGCASLSSIFGSWVAQKTCNYKKTVLAFYILSTLFCLVGVVTGYLTGNSASEAVPYLILSLMMLFQFGLYMATPVLLSWYHNIVGNDGWPRFFSTRMMIGDAAVLITSFIAGAVLGDNPGKGSFLIVFLPAILLGFTGIYFMSMVPGTAVEEAYAGARDYLKTIAEVFKKPPFRSLLIVIFIRNFAYSMIMPFQPVFLLEKLKMDYIRISVLICLGTCASILAYKAWARVQKKYGNDRGLRWNMAASVIDPLLWMAAVQGNEISIYAAFILFGLAGAQGLVNAGYFPCCLGTVLDFAEERLKPIYTSLYYIVYGIATTISPLAGGFLVRHFNALPIQIPWIQVEVDGYRLLFALSAVLLALAACLSAFSRKNAPADSRKDI